MSTTRKQYYKVCRVFNDRYYSAFNMGNGYDPSDVSQSSILKYKLNETTVPNLGKIYAFDNEQKLREWIDKTFSSYQYNDPANAIIIILKGHGKRSSMQVAVKSISIFTHIAYFWKHRYNSFLSEPAPDGTVLLNSFTPLEKVSVKEFMQS